MSFYERLMAATCPYGFTEAEYEEYLRILSQMILRLKAR